MKKGKMIPLSAENRAMSFFASTYGTLMEEVVRKYGDEGKKLIYDAYHKSIKDTGSQDWEKIPQNDLLAYVEWIFGDPWEGYSYEFLEKTPKSVRMRVKACPLATHFRKQGFGELAIVFCDVDYDMIEDFNAITGSKLAFERSKILMKGDDHCNHHFYVRE